MILRKLRIVCAIFSLCIMSNNFMFMPSMQRPGMNMPPVNYAPSMPYNNSGGMPMGPAGGFQPNQNQMNQAHDSAAPLVNSVMTLWTEEDLRGANTIRYNWYSRQKDARNTYYVYQQITVLVEEVEQFIINLENNINDYKKKTKDYEHQISLDIHKFKDNFSNINQFYALCAELEKELQVINNDDFVVKSKDYKMSILRAKNDLKNIGVMIKRVIDDLAMLGNGVHQMDSIVEVAVQQKNYIQSLEASAWENYQKLDELISDAEVRGIVTHIKNALDNAQQSKVYLEREINTFIKETEKNLLSGWTQIVQLVQRIISEVQNIQKQIDHFNQLKAQELAKQQKEMLEEQEKRAREESETKAREVELQKRKALLARPWYKKFYQDDMQRWLKSISLFSMRPLYDKVTAIFGSFISQPWQKVKQGGLYIYNLIGRGIDAIIGNKPKQKKVHKKEDEAVSEESLQQPKDLIQEFNEKAQEQQQEKMKNQMHSQESYMQHPGMPQQHMGQGMHPPIPMAPGMQHMQQFGHQQMQHPGLNHPIPSSFQRPPNQPMPIINRPPVIQPPRRPGMNFNRPGMPINRPGMSPMGAQEATGMNVPQGVLDAVQETPQQALMIQNQAKSQEEMKQRQELMYEEGLKRAPLQLTEIPELTREEFEQEVQEQRFEDVAAMVPDRSPVFNQRGPNERQEDIVDKTGINDILNDDLNQLFEQDTNNADPGGDGLPTYGVASYTRENTPQNSSGGYYNEGFGDAYEAPYGGGVVEPNYFEDPVAASVVR